jgi:hypothetical protein
LWVLCVLSGRGLGDELIARPEESYRLWCVVEYDLETSWMRGPWPTGGCRAKNKHCMHDVILWRVPITSLQWKHNNAFLYLCRWLHVSVNYTYILTYY